MVTLSARQGLLRLAGKDYQWFRLTIMQSWAGGTNSSGQAFAGDGSNFTLRRWALLDDNGVNQIEDLPHNTAADGRPSRTILFRRISVPGYWQ